ncbi:IclR family transcriptional regulator [Actinoplanes sp. NPDC051861]|uniref:IclR family transcriptional regulator n=1 Tax=Actinoplanes sp. NPDC051861 TaxID=3155170 RepID=UPI0034316613
MAGGTMTPGRSVTSRVLAILDTFDATHAEQSLTEIARRVGLPLATTYRLIGELAAWRGLCRRPDGRYEIGIRLWEVGLIAPVHHRLREVALPFLQMLYEATRENVHLAVRDGDVALYVEKLAGHRSVPIISRSGGRLPLHATGVGKALLAHEPEAYRREYLARPLPRFTRFTMVEPGRVAADLDRTVKRGYAVTVEEMTLGSCSVAAPVLSRSGRPVAAVGIVVHSVRVEPERFAPLIRLAAEGVAARLDASGLAGPGGSLQVARADVLRETYPQ